MFERKGQGQSEASEWDSSTHWDRVIRSYCEINSSEQRYAYGYHIPVMQTLKCLAMLPCMTPLDIPICVSPLWSWLPPISFLRIHYRSESPVSEEDARYAPFLLLALARDHRDAPVDLHLIGCPSCYRLHSLQPHLISACTQTLRT